MLDAVVTLRLEDADRRRLDALAARLPGSKRGPLARDLIRRALDTLEEDPSTVLRPSVAGPKGA